MLYTQREYIKSKRVCQYGFSVMIKNMNALPKDTLHTVLLRFNLEYNLKQIMDAYKLNNLSISRKGK